jgi:hypothetical protein
MSKLQARGQTWLAMVSLAGGRSFPCLGPEFFPPCSYLLVDLAFAVTFFSKSFLSLLKQMIRVRLVA